MRVCVCALRVHPCLVCVVIGIYVCSARVCVCGMRGSYVMCGLHCMVVFVSGCVCVCRVRVCVMFVVVRDVWGVFGRCVVCVCAWGVPCTGAV